MDAVDWDAAATVHERDDAGSEMYFEFKTLASGTLAEMVRFVCGMPNEDRARVVLDSAGRPTMAVTDIMALAARPDFPVT